MHPDFIKTFAPSPLLTYHTFSNDLHLLLKTQCWRTFQVYKEHSRRNYSSLLARLESAYSLIRAAHEIWGQSLGTFMISRPIYKAVIGGNLAFAILDLNN